MKLYRIVLAVVLMCGAYSVNLRAENKLPESSLGAYRIGVDDLLDISILQPERMSTTATVAIDGTISFPYIGNVLVKDMTLSQIQAKIQQELSNGYMKYPVVVVSLRESRSKKFFVYGEIIKPGQYLIEDNTTVLKAISLAGGFTKFGSSSRIKVLRENKDKPGYQSIAVNIKAITNGKAGADILIEPGDIVVVSEGIF